MGNRSANKPSGEIDYTILNIQMSGVAQDQVSLVGDLVRGVLDRHVRAEDVLLRYNNGRFVVVLVDVTPSGALPVSERLMRAVDALHLTGLVPGGMDFEVTISNHVHPDEAREPSVQAAVLGAISTRPSN